MGRRSQQTLEPLTLAQHLVGQILIDRAMPLLVGEAQHARRAMPVIVPTRIIGNGIQADAR